MSLDVIHDFLKKDVTRYIDELNKLRHKIEQIRINAYKFTPELALPEIKRILEEERDGLERH